MAIILLGDYEAIANIHITCNMDTLNRLFHINTFIVFSLLPINFTASKRFLMPDNILLVQFGIAEREGG